MNDARGEAPARGLPRWTLLFLLGLAGCGVAKGVVEMPGKAIGISSSSDPAAALIDLQQKLLRFTDSFQTSLAASLERVRRDGHQVESKTLLQWKLVLSQTAVTIASGANAQVNLLDMTVFVTLVHMAVETRWKPEVVGDAARVLQETCREADEDIWKLSAVILKPEEQAELRKALEEWHTNHPLPEEMLSARTAGFAAEVVEKSKTKSAKSDGMFSFLSLDPLANLDPAVREITQTRLFAERALFVAERLPTILRWQAELLSVSMLEMPTVTQLTAATTQMSASVDRITAVAEKLPDRVTKEREELVKALEAQEKSLAPMVKDVHRTVEAGTAMTEALNGTLKTLDAVVKRLTDAGVIGGPPSPNAEPFRIQDYIKAANQAEATTKQLTEAITAVDRLLASDGVRKLPEQISPVVTRAEAGARDVVDYAFTRGLILIGVVLAAALVYRIVSLRLARPAAPAAPKAP
jgi:hypothetical protein